MHPLNTNTNPSTIYFTFFPLSPSLVQSNLVSCCRLLLKPNLILNPKLKIMEVVMKLVETPPYYEPPQHHTQSRPTLGFPLGTALLLIIIFSLSGFFSCCYHWDKLRHLRGSFVDPDTDESSPTKPNLKLAVDKENKKESLPVIMAGDRIAKFMALPSPREPPREHKIIVQEVEKPPKPPHIVVPIYT